MYVAVYVDDMLLVGNKMNLIKEVKQQLSFKFDMKDIKPTHFILGVDIRRDKENKKLQLSRQKYIEEIMKRFNMQDCKPIKVPIHVGTKLYVDQCPKSQEKIEYMTHVPYANAFDSLMYVMVYT